MIINNEPISIAEASEYIIEKDKEEKIHTFIKKFSHLDAKKAKELRKKLESLDFMKIKSESIAKIIDVLPEDSEDLNKILNGVGLDEDETKKILDAVKSI
jgi:DNA-directed RNA polymerase subunit F